MKVVLVDPPTSHEQLYGDWDLSKLDTQCPPLGLLYIASYIRERGHEPRVVDVPARRWTLEETVDFVRRYEPGCVGISAKTINIIPAARLAEAIRAAGLDCPIVLGGAHATAAGEETLQRFECFDVAVVGEGEVTFHELLERFEAGTSIEDLPGIVHRGEDGRVRATRPAEAIEDLDALPLPAWDLLPEFPHGYTHSPLETKRLPAASIITSRGCPYKCAFCDTAVFGRKVRHHGPEYTLRMIRHLRDTYGVRDLMILDDNFMIKRDKLFAICDELEHMDISWYCLTHEKLLTRDRLERVAKAGCWILELGIESGSDEILRRINKKTSTREIAEGVRLAREIGLKVKGNFILGFPGETKETLQETIDFATRSPMSMDPDAHGTSLGTWENMAHQRITYIPHGLTETDLVDASKEAFRRFYLRPRVIMEVLRGLTSVRAVKNAVTAGLTFVRTLARPSPPQTTPVSPPERPAPRKPTPNLVQLRRSTTPRSSLRGFGADQR
jgi:radical SAM superfamily enzyme YgiQ (UPF0313 family)